MDYIPAFMVDADRETVTEACWAVAFYLEKSSEKTQRIKNIVYMNITDKLLELFGEDDPITIRPVLRILCHLSYGTNDIIQVFYTNRLVESLYNALYIGYSKLRGEAAWTISNLILTNEKIALDFFIPDLLNKIIDMAINDSRLFCRIEALSILHSFVCTMCARIIDELIFRYRLLDLIMEMLKDPETQIVEKSLDLLGKILQYGGTLDQTHNQAALYIQDHFDMDIFFELQKKESHAIYTKTKNLLMDYFNDIIE